MSQTTYQLTLIHNRLLANIKAAIVGLALDGKVWANGEDSAIQIDNENIGLQGYVFSFDASGDNLIYTPIKDYGSVSDNQEDWEIKELDRANITDLIDILGSMETYGQTTPELAAAN